MRKGAGLRGLDDLPPGVQQDGVGVRPRSEDAIAVVEVIGERLRQLVGGAALLFLLLLAFLGWRRRGGRSPVLSLWGVSLSGPDALVLLGLQGNQGRGQT